MLQCSNTRAGLVNRVSLMQGKNQKRNADFFNYRKT